MAKLNPLGAVVWSKQIPVFTINSTAVSSRAELVITGLAGRGIQPTAGGGRICSTLGTPFPVKAVVTRSDTATGTTNYAGFLNADQSWLAGPEQVIAEAPYVGLQQFSLLPTGSPPPGTVTWGMASAAVYDSTAIAPGEIVSIFGTNIGPSKPFSGNSDADGNISSEIGGMTVSIAGIPAPFLYADPGQINLVTPFAIPTAGTVPVEIRRNGSLISAFEKQVSEIQAALFTSDGSGIGLLATLNQDGSINSSANPASSQGRSSVSLEADMGRCLRLRWMGQQLAKPTPSLWWMSPFWYTERVTARCTLLQASLSTSGMRLAWSQASFRLISASRM